MPTTAPNVEILTDLAAQARRISLSLDLAADLLVGQATEAQESLVHACRLLADELSMRLSESAWALALEVSR